MKCKDPAKEATKWQGPGNRDYPGIDVYENTVIKKGRYFMLFILMEIGYLLIL